MPSNVRNRGYHQYQSRINHLFKFFDDNEPEHQAHNAKYLAVLVSGYLEQAVKELLLKYASQGTRPQIYKYVEETWPISRNMNTSNIDELLRQFNSVWSEQFLSWLNQREDRKNNINSVVRWRNGIAHGQESNTTGVTLVSVKNAFSTVSELILFIESIVQP